MLQGDWQALNSLSIHVTLTAIVPGAYPGEAKTCKNVLKLRTLDFTALITGKRLKIDGYMLRGLWPALNSLSIHVKFTAIVPGAYPGEAKMCKNVRKWRPLDLTAWVTGEKTVDDRWVHVQKRLTSIEFSFDPCNIYPIVPGAYPGESKMWLENAHSLTSILLKTSHSPPLYRYIS